MDSKTLLSTMAAGLLFFTLIRFWDIKKDKGSFIDWLKNDSNSSTFINRAFDYALYAIIAIFIANFIILMVDDKHSAGTFGDFIGGTLNPILSFLTFTGLLWGLAMQRMELQYVKEEFEKNRDVFNTQIQLQKEQKFQSHFSFLLSVLQADSMRLSGRIEAGKFESGMFSWMINHTKSDFIAVAAQTVSTNDDIFDSYYRRVFNLLKSVNNHYCETGIYSPDKAMEEKQYINIIKSSLDSIGLKVLMYRLMSDDLLPYHVELKRMIEDYEIFEVLIFANETNVDENICEMASKFHESAFGKSSSYQYAKKNGIIKNSTTHN